MALQKVTFNNAHVTGADHGAIFAGILSDGRIVGCDVHVSNGVASIDSGYFIACGRLIHNNSDLENITLSGSGGNIAQIVLAIDISNDSTPLNDMLSVRRAASVGALSPLAHNDINDGVNTLYEFEIAVIDISNNTFIRKMPIAARPIYVLEAAPENNDWTGYADGIYLIKSSNS